MTDLKDLTAAELLTRFQDRIIVSLRNPEWHEIRRRLERLEKCQRIMRDIPLSCRMCKRLRAALEKS